MAAKTLKRGEAIVWLPARSAGETRLRQEASLVALMGGTPEVQARRVSLDALQGIGSIWLVLDTRDCTVLQAELPPISGARLLQALPNVVEEHLLQDPAECLLVLGPEVAAGQARLIAAADREWVEVVLAAFEAKGHRIMGLWPAAEALPGTPRHASLGCINDGIVLRVGEFDALGWPAPATLDDRVEALRGLMRLAGLAPHPSGSEPPTLTAWIDQPDWSAPLEQAARAEGLPVEIMPLPASFDSRLDLLEARPARARRMLSKFDPSTLRVPGVLALSCVLAALIGLNLHWWQLRAERDAARAALEAGFRAAVPSAQVVVDPLLQMPRHGATLSAAAGQTSAQDAMPLLGRLAEALGSQSVDSLAGLEYVDGRMKLRFRADRVESRASREQLQAACARAGLQLRFDNEREPTATLTPGG
jgi:general secretion pathway protein L